jgi:hypothetical protein
MKNRNILSKSIIKNRGDADKWSKQSPDYELSKELCGLAISKNIHWRLSFIIRRFSVLLLFAVLGFTQSIQAQPRVVVMTDIGGDPDDIQTMVRFLSYANEFDIRGLYATSTRRAINVSIIEDMVTAWGSVRDNLSNHAGGWPTEDYLLSVIKGGRLVEGIYWCGIGNGVQDPEIGLAGGICTPGVQELIGKGMDSDASEHLIAVIDESPEPTWVLAWGGTRELAQAIWKVGETRNEQQLKTFISRIRLYSISLQDETMPWLLNEFPDLFIIRTRLSHRGIYRYNKLDTALLNSTWCNTHIRNNHGALGAMYAGNLKGTFDKHGMKEGDTPAVMYLINNGLSDPSEPGMGNWGGRFYPTLGDKHWFEAEDDNPYTEETMLRIYWSVSRYHVARQNDFEARMDWQRYSNYGDANHNPVVVLNGDQTKNVLRKTVSAGTMVHLIADGTTDPDGDALNYYWWEYYEVGSDSGTETDQGPTVSISSPCSKITGFIAPDVSVPKDIHIILEVTDDGSPNLTSYRRMIVTVKP